MHIVCSSERSCLAALEMFDDFCDFPVPTLSLRSSCEKGVQPFIALRLLRQMREVMSHECSDEEEIHDSQAWYIQLQFDEVKRNG